MAEPKRTAIVLFNLGGPDKLKSVQPFLFNLFNDGAVIALPALLRWPVAKLISRRRAPVARGDATARWVEARRFSLTRRRKRGRLRQRSAISGR